VTEARRTQGSGTSRTLLPSFTSGWPLVKRDRSGGDTRLGNDGDDPARRFTGLGFHDRMDQPRDKRSLNRQGCLLATMLVVAAASRDFWIGRLERLHIDQAAANETVPLRERCMLMFRQSACGIGGLINLFGDRRDANGTTTVSKGSAANEMVSTIIAHIPHGLVRLATA